MTTGPTSYMRESFVGELLRKSVRRLEHISARLRLNVLCWYTSEEAVWIQYKKRNRNVGPDHSFLNWNIGCKRHIADRALVPLRGLPALLQKRFMSKWWNWSKVEATIKTFEPCQFYETRLFICRLKSEDNCSGKNARNMHVSWMTL